MNEVRFKPAEDDLLAAQRLFQRAALPRAILRISLVVGVVVVLFALASGDFNWFVVVGGIVGGFAGWAICVAIGRYWTLPRTVRKTFRLDKALKSETTLKWSATEVEMTSLQGQMRMPLRDLACWLSNEDVLLLFRSQNMFHFVPSRVFPDAAKLAELKQALAANEVPNRWPPR